MHRILWVTLAIIGSMLVYAGAQLQATTTNPPTITLEKSVHFLTPSGDDVVVEGGTYEVEAAEEWLRMIPQGEDRGKAVLLAASRSPHGMEVATPEVRLIHIGEDQEYVWLLLPDGQSWIAKGSYSGVRSREVEAPSLVDARLEHGVEFIGPAYFDSSAFANQGLDPRVSLGFCLMHGEEFGGAAWTWYPDTQGCKIVSSITETRPNASVVSARLIPSFFLKAGPQTDESGNPINLPQPHNDQLSVIYPYFNSFFPSGGYKNFQSTLANCHMECAKDGRCHAFSWNKATNICYFRNSSNGRADSVSNYISGFKTSYMQGIVLKHNEYSAKVTKKNLPLCIQAVLQGQTVRFVNPIFGKSWYCYPAQFLLVHNPDFRSRVVAALYRGVRGGAEENSWFNKLLSDMKLASSPPNTQLMFGYISHPVTGKNDVAYYTVSLSRVSANETLIHATRVDFREGGIFNTPILGTLIKLAIEQGVSYLTGGIPFSGTLAVMAIEHIANEGGGGNEGAANRIIGAIALSAGPILPMPTISAPVIQPKTSQSTKPPLGGRFSFGEIRSRGLDHLPPLVIPDPIPPTLPNTETQRVTP